MDGVRGVFKSLVGTIIVIICLSLFIEMANMNSVSTFLKSNIARTVENSCDYFASETYKEGNSTVDGVYGLREDGTEELYMSGRFYGGDPYESLYGSGSPFSEWYQTDYAAMANGGKGWRNLDRLAYGLGLRSNGLALTDTDKRAGESYVEVNMTPLNLGIPYLDEETVENIARWNLARTLSSGKPENIHINGSLYENGIKGDRLEAFRDANGNIDDSKTSYVLHNGFRCYVDTFQIDDIDYKIYDLNDASDKSKLEAITGMEDGNGGGGMGTLLGNIDAGQGEGLTAGVDDRQFIGVAEITYTMDMDYIGITPIRRIINWLANMNIEGFGQGSTAANDRMGPVQASGSTFSSRNSSESQSVMFKDRMYYYIIR